MALMPVVYGLTSMIRIVFAASPGAGKAYRSVKSSRASSPGNLR